MAKPDTRLRIVNVLDPMMCLRCPHAHIAEVLFTDGTTRKMFYCSRLDCDNWNTTTDDCEAEPEDFRESA